MMRQILSRTVIALFLLVLIPLAARADDTASPSAVAGRAAQLKALLSSDQGAAILNLLGDPAVRQAVLQETDENVSSHSGPGTVGQMMDGMLTGVRTRLWGLGAEIGHLPHDLTLAWENLRSLLPGQELLKLFVCIVVFAAGGSAAQLLFFRLSRPWRAHFGRAALCTPRERVSMVFERLLFGTLVIGAFAAGSMGAFVLFSWPPLTGSIILGYLLASLMVRFSLTTTRFFLAPGAERLRLVPVSTKTARFWHRWAAVLVAVAAVGWQILVTLHVLNMPQAGLDLLLQLLLLVLMTLGICIVWTMPRQAEQSVRGALPRALVSFGLVFDWLLFLMGAFALGWSLLILSAVPAAMFVLCKSITTVVLGRWPDPDAEHTAHVAIAQRIMQAIVILAAAAAMIYVWQIDMIEMSNIDTPMTRIGRGLLEALVILVIADLLWQVVRVLIDVRLAGEHISIDDLDDVQLRRRARLRTFLPVLRNFVFFLVLVMASLSALAAMGLQIGPLLAGAGVVGIAVGFGAQTLVRDILSGVFFLLDDAFRVGEHIESGGIRGTVESFSLRSVKLRHFNGQLHTVPFGDLKAITNYSRDWVVERIQINVAYDTDLDLLDHVIEKVSDELAEDPAVATSMIEPLKSLGVQAMLDTGMQIGLMFKTRPGQQFAVRRVVFHRIKTAFLANGIRFGSAAAAQPGPAELVS